MKTLQNIHLQTASLSELHRVAPPEMMAKAEIAATKAMAKLSNPFYGAREIVIAQHLRKALRAWKAAESGENNGTLHDYRTGEAIRPATEEETAASCAAGREGVISINGRACYVSR